MVREEMPRAAATSATFHVGPVALTSHKGGAWAMTNFRAGVCSVFDSIRRALQTMGIKEPVKANIKNYVYNFLILCDKLRNPEQKGRVCMARKLCFVRSNYPRWLDVGSHYQRF
jgi:hypothetical protein